MKFSTRANGRVTILGEHQDYLGLTVIATPVPAHLIFNWETKSTTTGMIRLKSHLLNREDAIYYGEPLRGDAFDLARACTIVLKNHGYEFPWEVNVEVTGNLPPNSGTSSSAAFSISFLKGLIRLLQEKNKKIDDSPLAVAEMAFEAENHVLGVPCGRLDQYTCSFDQPLVLTFDNPVKIEKIPFVFPIMVVNSTVPKSTEKVHEGIQRIIRSALMKELKTTNLKDIKKLTIERVKSSNRLTDQETTMLTGILEIHETTKRLSSLLLKSPKIDSSILQELGTSMFREHTILKENLAISHPKLDKIVELAKESGAYGAKLSGAGKGGVVTVLTDGKKETIENIRMVMEENHFPVLCY